MTVKEHYFLGQEEQSIPSDRMSLLVDDLSQQVELDVSVKRLCLYGKAGLLNEYASLFKQSLEDGRVAPKDFLNFFNQFASSVWNFKINRVRWITSLFEGQELDQLAEWQDLLSFCVVQGARIEVFNLLKHKSLEELEAWKPVLLESVKSSGTAAEFLKLFETADLKTIIQWSEVIELCALYGNAATVVAMLEDYELEELLELRSVIKVCTENGSATEILKWFKGESLLDNEARLSSWHQILLAAVSAGESEAVLALFPDLSFEDLNNSALVKDIAVACANQGLGLEMIKLVEGQTLADLNWFDQFLVACASHGAAKEVLTLFQEIDKDRIKPHLWKETLQACATGAVASEVVEFLLAYNSDLKVLIEWDDVLVSCVREGSAQKVFALINDLDLSDPEAQQWQTVLAACAEAGYSAELVQKLVKTELSSNELQEWSLLLKSCSSDCPSEVMALIGQGDIRNLVKWEGLTLHICKQEGQGHIFGSLVKQFGLENFVSWLAQLNSNQPSEWNFILKTAVKNGASSQILSSLQEKSLAEIRRLKSVVSISFTLALCAQLNPKETWSLFEHRDLSQWRGFEGMIANCVRASNSQEIFDKLKDQDLQTLIDFRFILRACVGYGLAKEVFALFSDVSVEASMPEYSQLRSVFRECGQFHSPSLVRLILLEANKTLQELEVKPDYRREIIDSYQDLLTNFSFPELIFFNLAVKKDGFFNTKLLGMAERFSRFVVELDKTGSRLYVMKKRQGEINVVNEIRTKSAQIWSQLAQNNIIPCAPVYQMNEREHGMTRVYSRFCGLAFRRIDLSRIPDSMLQEINRQREAIEQTLRENHISHGHLHQGNFVLELIDKDYFEQEGGWQSVNQIPWSSQNFSYDIDQLKTEPDAWQPVVRLIDYDQAEKNQYLARDPSSQS